MNMHKPNRLNLDQYRPNAQARPVFISTAPVPSKRRDLITLACWAAAGLSIVALAAVVLNII